MGRNNNRRIKSLHKVINELHKVINELKEKVKTLSRIKERFYLGKQEHNASLVLINELADDLPNGWTRKYDEERKRFLYCNTSKKLHFWSANVQQEDSELDDLHPDDYDG